MSLSQNFPTLRPTLRFDFINSSLLDPRITFTRASTATFFNSAGVLTSAAINTPRLDYNPSTLAAQGFLVEESRTNLCLQSEDWGSATWSKSGSTITANATTAPTGTAVADKLVEDTSTGTHITTQSISLGGSVDNSAYVISVFAKASERTRFQLFDNAQASSGITAFDLSNGTVVSGTGTITAVGNGWYRCSVFPLKSTSITSTLTIRLISTGTTTSYTGDGTSGIFVFGAQLEAGAFPTSYIPTTTTALTRAADVASVNTLSPWFNSASSTLYSEFVWEGLKSTSGQTYAQFDDGSTNNRIVAAAGSSNANIMTTTSGGTSDGSTATPATVFATNTIYKTALALAANDLQSFVNGAAGTADTTVTLPVGLTNLKLAANLSATSNVWLRRLTYYPRRLSQSEGIAITA
jgi:hypothetical protein